MRRSTAAALLLVLFAAVLFPAAASAFQYRMNFGQAKHESRTYAIGLCKELKECSGFAVGACNRISLSRFDCEIGEFFPGVEPGEEIECNQELHWGVSYSGYVKLKRHGSPRCFTL